MSLRDCTAFSARVLGLLIALYFFICSLDLLSDAFRLVGGKTAGQVLGNNKLLTNPVAGLMIGELATVLLQSSSATTSILVSMVAGDLLSVHNAIPIVMGANIGTSMTNTLVSLGHSVDRAQFERAFAGATVHDMFNYLSVTCLLPIEVAFGLIERCTGLIVADINGMSKGADLQLLNVLTDPLTRRIIEVNKNKIAEIAENTALQSNVTIKYDSLIKKCNNQEYNLDPCGYRHIFAYSTWSDLTIGLILLLVSIAALIACLIAIVKLLHSMLNGPMLAVIQKAVNTDLPGRCGYFTGYIAIAIGCGMTFLVQSSSVFTSALTPLVGMGVISLERMYPLTLGANIGTTFTSLLAALASEPAKIKHTVQLALCHLLFNVMGTAIFYPVPFMRLPIRAARLLAAVTAKYRWFAGVYLVVAFFFAPVLILALSLAGPLVMLAVLTPIFGAIMIIVVVNMMQLHAAKYLPKKLRDWNFLPKYLHSLKPYDNLIGSAGRSLGCCVKCRQGPVIPTQIANFTAESEPLASSDKVVVPEPTEPNHLLEKDNCVISISPRTYA